MDSRSNSCESSRHIEMKLVTVFGLSVSLSSGSQLGVILPLEGHLTMSEDNFGCHNWVNTKRMYGVKARDAGKHLIAYSTASHN